MRMRRDSGAAAAIAEAPVYLYDVIAPRHNHRKEVAMKNPLDSLGQTVLLGFILAGVAHLLIRALA
jgi:hypothetical protein